MDPLFVEIPTDRYIAVPEPRNAGVTRPVIATLNPPQNSLDTKKINVARGPDVLSDPHAIRTHPITRTVQLRIHPGCRAPFTECFATSAFSKYTIRPIREQLDC